MNKKDREAVLKLWGEPLPNEDEYFKGVRENILKTINLLSARIDFLESQLKIDWHKYPNEMFIPRKDTMYSCSKHNYTGLNNPCPDCKKELKEFAEKWFNLGRMSCETFKDLWKEK